MTFIFIALYLGGVVATLPHGIGVTRSGSHPGHLVFMTLGWPLFVVLFACGVVEIDGHAGTDLGDL